MSTYLREKIYSVRILLFLTVVLTPSISKGGNYFTLPQYVTTEATSKTFQIASDGKALTVFAPASIRAFTYIPGINFC